MPVLLEKEPEDKPQEPLRASLGELLARKLQAHEQGRGGKDKRRKKGRNAEAR